MEPSISAPYSAVMAGVGFVITSANGRHATDFCSMVSCVRGNGFTMGESWGLSAPSMASEEVVEMEGKI